MTFVDPVTPVPVGGTTGVNHAKGGTCQYHPAVMVPDGKKCPLCHPMGIAPLPAILDEGLGRAGKSDPLPVLPGDLRQLNPATPLEGDQSND